MVVILCFAYFPLFLLGIGVIIATMGIPYDMFLHFAVGPLFIIIYRVPLTVFFSCRYIRVKYKERNEAI